MPAHKLVSDAQDRVLLDFVQENPGLALGRVSAQAAPLAKLQAQEAWESLASRLNAIASGTTKSAVKWKDYWNERKCAVRKKAAKLRAYAVGTGGGPAKTTKLTDVEEEILHIIGKISVYGRAFRSNTIQSNRINVGAPQWALAIENRRLEVEQMLATAVQRLATAAEVQARFAEASALATERIAAAVEVMNETAVSNNQLLRLLVDEFTGTGQNCSPDRESSRIL